MRYGRHSQTERSSDGQLSLADQSNVPPRLWERGCIQFLFECADVGEQVGDGFIRHAVDQTAWHEGGRSNVMLLADGALGDVGDHATLVGDTRATIVLPCFEALGD